jgi:translation initiation factor RLI1
MNTLQKRTGRDKDKERRICVVDYDKVKAHPSETTSFAYLRRHAGVCGKECILHDKANKKIIISERACLVCINTAKRCPDNAVRIVRLPSNLDRGVAHSFGEGCFRLNGLPAPQRGRVLGLLGANGVGKSTAVGILSGTIKPNLGQFKNPPGWADIIRFYRGSALQNYFREIVQGNVTASVKPQMHHGYAAELGDVTVAQAIYAADQRASALKLMKQLSLLHLAHRNVVSLSGGELQRVAIAVCLSKKADLYVIDEPSSFLDIKQRLGLRRVISQLVADTGGEVYIVVVEHDLTVLSSVADKVATIYGEPGAYGVVTFQASKRPAINNYLAGYLPTQNVRFRAEPITFWASRPEHEESVGLKNPDHAAGGGGVGRRVVLSNKNNALLVDGVSAAPNDGSACASESVCAGGDCARAGADSSAGGVCTHASTSASACASADGRLDFGCDAFGETSVQKEEDTSGSFVRVASQRGDGPSTLCGAAAHNKNSPGPNTTTTHVLDKGNMRYPPVTKTFAFSQAPEPHLPSMDGTDQKKQDKKEDEKQQRHRFGSGLDALVAACSAAATKDALAFNHRGFRLDAEGGCLAKGGEVVVLLGENGTGKTTLLELIAQRLGAASRQQGAEKQSSRPTDCTCEASLSCSQTHKRGKSCCLALVEKSRNAMSRADVNNRSKDGSAFLNQAAAVAGDDTKGRGSAPTNPSIKADAQGQSNTADTPLKRVVAVKRQHPLEKARKKWKGTVGEFLNASPAAQTVHDRMFRQLVLKPLHIDEMEHLKLSSLSGGELQRLAIVMCLGTPMAQAYLFDEPSAALDCEHRVTVAKVIKRWAVGHLHKTVFVVEHDFAMASILADRVIVFSGTPGVECLASTPLSVNDGFNQILRQIDVTMHLDARNGRPCVNKHGGQHDQRAKKSGQYYQFDVAAKESEE